MKKMKKRLCLLLSLVMVFALATTAFAADPETGTITVDNPTENNAYTAYKIFDVTYNEDKTAYAYTIDSDAPGTWFQDVLLYMGSTWQEGTGYSGAAVGADAKGVYTGKGITLTPSAADSTVFVVGINEDNTKGDVFSAPDFARFLKTKMGGYTGVRLEADASGKPTKTGLDFGYYFVASTSGALCNLTTTNPNATIHDKNDNPFDKVDDKESVEVGETVTYTITGKVPDTTGFDTYTYEINDVMSTGLTFNKNVEVKIIDGAENGSDVTLTAGPDTYTVTYDVPNPGETEGNPNRFKVSINAIKLRKYVTKEIKVTYTATVNENAVGKVEKNSATLTYSNDPTDSAKTTVTPPEEATVYSAEIVIDKYAAKPGDPTATDGKKLAGATFVLYRYALPDAGGNVMPNSFVDGGGASYTAEDAKANTALVKVYYKAAYDTSSPAKLIGVSWYQLAAGETLQTAIDDAKITAVTTDDHGAADFDGLEDGTYYLEETVAPAGYNLLDAPVEVTINGKDETNLTPLTHIEGIANSTGSILPETGGMGTTVFYILGSILLIGAVVLLVTKKRMDAEK